MYLHPMTQFLMEAAKVGKVDLSASGDEDTVIYIFDNLFRVVLRGGSDVEWHALFSFENANNEWQEIGDYPLPFWQAVTHAFHDAMTRN